MRMVLAMVTGLALSGCTSLITPSNSTAVVQASLSSSERTYRAVLGMLNECFPTDMSIESNYFPDAREGEITVAMKADFVRVDVAKIAFAPAGDGSTVKMMRNTSLDKLDKALPEWVNGKDGGCPYGSRYENPTPSHNPYGAAASK